MPEKEYHFSPEEAALVAEYQQVMRDVQQQLKGALCLITKQRRLEGNWTLDGGRLVQAGA